MSGAQFLALLNHCGIHAEFTPVYSPLSRSLTARGYLSTSLSQLSPLFPWRTLPSPYLILAIIITSSLPPLLLLFFFSMFCYSFISSALFVYLNEYKQQKKMHKIRKFSTDNFSLHQAREVQINKQFLTNNSQTSIYISSVSKKKI